MSVKHVQEADAQREVAALNQSPLGFCPVCNASCRVDCVAFTRSYVSTRMLWIEDTRKDEMRYEAIPPKCGYIKLFVGESQ
jgi:hypothetical protein